MPTYVPRVYRAQGATELIVTSGGYLSIEDGGYISMEDGATLTLDGQAITTTGDATVNDLTVSAGADVSSDLSVAYGLALSSGFYVPVYSASSASTAVRPYGLNFITSCGLTSGAVYTIPGAHGAGVSVEIQCGSCACSSAPAVVSSTGMTFGASNTNITFSTGGANVQFIRLVAITTARWAVVGMSTDVALS